MLDESKVDSLMEFEDMLNEACGQEDMRESGKIDRFEHAALVLMINGVIKMETLQAIMKSLNELDVDGRGSISKADSPSALCKRPCTVSMLSSGA